MVVSRSGVPLYTSIPPKMVRMDGNSRDIGPAYGRACVESWIAAGLRPHSVNAQREAKLHHAMYPEVKFLSCAKDASAVVGKPLVFLSDMIRIICERESGPVVLTNADIMIRPSEAFMAKLQEVRPGHFIVECRYDLPSMEADTGDMYIGGYDFFAIHTHDLYRMLVNPLVIGMPWWDYFVPFFLLGVGVKPIETPLAPIYHLAHSERWDIAAWSLFGRKFTTWLLALPDLDDASKAILGKPAVVKTRGDPKTAIWPSQDLIFGANWDQYAPAAVSVGVNRFINQAVPKLRDLRSQDA